MSAPDKILANPYFGMQPNQTSGIWKLENAQNKGTEYVRADLLPPPAADYVAVIEAVNDLAKILMDAWAKAEPNHGVTKHPTSYVSTFVDMARAALAACPASPDTRVAPDMPPTADRELLDDNDPDGYLVSDRDWCAANAEAVEWFIENHAAIRAIIDGGQDRG